MYANILKSLKRVLSTYRDYVWQDPELLEGPHVLPGSAESGLNLVGDADTSVLPNDLVDL